MINNDNNNIDINSILNLWWYGYVDLLGMYRTFFFLSGVTFLLKFRILHLGDCVGWGLFFFCLILIFICLCWWFALSSFYRLRIGSSYKICFIWLKGRVRVWTECLGIFFCHFSCFGDRLCG